MLISNHLDERGSSFYLFRSGTGTFQVLTEEFTPDSLTSRSFLTAELRQPIRIQAANPRVWNKVILQTSSTHLPSSLGGRCGRSNAGGVFKRRKCADSALGGILH